MLARVQSNETIKRIIGSINFTWEKKKKIISILFDSNCVHFIIFPTDIESDFYLYNKSSNFCEKCKYFD